MGWVGGRGRPTYIIVYLVRGGAGNEVGGREGSPYLL